MNDKRIIWCAAGNRRYLGIYECTHSDHPAHAYSLREPARALHAKLLELHYENTPIQIYRKFHLLGEAVLTSTHNLCF